MKFDDFFSVALFSQNNNQLLFFKSKSIFTRQSKFFKHIHKIVSSFFIKSHLWSSLKNRCLLFVIVVAFSFIHFNLSCRFLPQRAQMFSWKRKIMTKAKYSENYDLQQSTKEDGILTTDKHWPIREESWNYVFFLLFRC